MAQQLTVSRIVSGFQIMTKLPKIQTIPTNVIFFPFINQSDVPDGSTRRILGHIEAGKSTFQNSG